MRKVTYSEPKRFICDECEQFFASENNLKNHMLLHTGEKRRKCKICNLRFMHAYQLRKHVCLVHEGGMPYKCEVCGHGFLWKTQYFRHTRTHLKVKPYTCEICDRRFKRFENFFEHKKVHTEEKPFQCDACKRKFRLKALLNKHACRVHAKGKRIKNGTNQRKNVSTVEMDGQSEEKMEIPTTAEQIPVILEKEQPLPMQSGFLNCSVAVDRLEDLFKLFDEYLKYRTEIRKDMDDNLLREFLNMKFGLTGDETRSALQSTNQTSDHLKDKNDVKMADNDIDEFGDSVIHEILKYQQEFQNFTRDNSKKNSEQEDGGEKLI